MRLSAERAIRSLLAVALLPVLGLVLHAPSHAAPEAPVVHPIRIGAARFAVSRPWGELATEAECSPSPRWLRPPSPDDFDAPNPRQLRPVGRHGEDSAPLVDPLLRSDRFTGRMEDPIASFEGLAGLDNQNVYGKSWSPSDCVGDIGPNHYVEAVNNLYRVFDRSGKPLIPPAKYSTLFAGLGEPASKYDDGDPVVRYDRMADRWVITVFVVGDWLEGLGPARTVVAVSKTPDPTGPFFLYDFPMPNNNMNDYPKLGVWPDGYYVSVNQFEPPPEYTSNGAGVFAFDRIRMLRGDPGAAAVYMDLSGFDNTPYSLLPADLDGAPPAHGTPHVFACLISPEIVANPPSKPSSPVRGTGSTEIGSDGKPVPYGLRLFTLSPNFRETSASTLIELPTIPVAPYRMVLGDRLVPQRGTTNGLAPVSDRLMNRLQFRHFAGHDSLVVNHSVQVDPSGVVGVRYYEVRRILPNGAPFLQDQGTHAPDSDSRWMASAALDWQGNLAIGYSVSGTNTHPGIRYAGRTQDAPPGGLNRSEALLQAGSASQEYFRWGDYNSMSVDPVDDSTFWYVNNYLTESIGGNWRTRIGSFRFTNSVPRRLSTLRISVVDAATGEPIPDASVTVGNGYWQHHDGPDGVRFRLEDGVHTVAAEAPGHAPITNTVTVVDGTHTLHTLTLRTIDHAITVSGPPFLAFKERAGGPFDTNGITLTLTNSGAKPTSWEISLGSRWAQVEPDHGTLGPRSAIQVRVRLADSATNMVAARYEDLLVVSMPQTGTSDARSLNLLLENNPGLLQFRSRWTTVDFNSPAARLEIDRIDGTDGLVSVRVDTGSLGAIEGTDFEGQHRTVIFRAGETNKTLVIPLSASPARPSKSFLVTLGNQVGGARLGATSVTTVTVTDDVGLISREFLESDPGWAGQSVWTWGQPGGKNKPHGGYTGLNAYAYDLHEDYRNNLKTTEYLTSPVFDASRHRNLTLHFVRWLTIERGLSDQASVEVSTNGTDWTRVWVNPVETSLNTKEWVPQTVALPSWTDGSPTLQIRWGMGPTDTSRTAGGWVLDDIELFGDPIPQALSISLDRGSGTDASVVLSWASQAGEAYTVESSEGVGQPFVTLQKDIVSTPPRTQFVHRLDPAGSGQLLRVRRQ